MASVPGISGLTVIVQNTVRLAMKKFLVATSLFLSLSAPVVFGQVAWVNEFHYDNISTDAGEFFEVFVQTGTSLSDLTLDLYRDTGTIYDSHSLDTFTFGASVTGGDLYSKSIGSVQNGPADGWALSGTGLTTQAYSYEGTFTGVEGPANGITSIDIGVDESNSSTAVGSALGLTGTGSSLNDFTWSVMNGSPGALNVGQTISTTAIPEPSTYALIFGALTLGLVAWKRRRATS